ncbi:probable xyloglucan endotransglucosylase/hydrolase protein 26 [Zingiber officinale]|uniref:probable xyloglucan endotransglucosylase/hydrolase protein 26 n=1 Tax=Zingiber officinale TaxID=94328 RepID=UPI001C4C25B7|nr:probable xyloglucan endotransglucosylase/hydrolase protein 26 [Zingiber officinale]
MARLFALAMVLVLLVALDRGLVDADFYRDVDFVWGSQNSGIWNNGDSLALMLNNVSGCGMVTRNQYLFGSIEVQIKLVKANSAGTVIAYYLSSTGEKHDEIDFEFLGNETGQPYIIHTNIFVQGVGNREEQFYPWFDPSTDFHNYTIHWNPSQVVWFVDGIPIRVFRNYESQGIPFPDQQAMRAYSSIWVADDWATRGGLVKVDWSCAPFVAYYEYLRLRACPWYGPTSTGQCAETTPANWWTRPGLETLDYQQQGRMNWVREKYMIYDYCKDEKRFNGVLPHECHLPKY